MTNKENDLEARALSLLDEALDQPSETRADWVHEQTVDDDELRGRVLTLLDLDVSDVSFTGKATEALLGNPEAEAEIPSRIGQYRIEKLIGRGGMGAVYLGHRDVGDFDHSVAVKVVRGLRNVPRLAERLRAERQTLAKLQHEHIAALFDGGETEDGDPFFVMEFVDGQSLRDVIKSKTLTPDAALDLISQIAAAVQYAHQQFVVHRDLSPSNILVNSAGKAKLIDFGISQSLSTSESEGGAQYTLTKGYAAPERLRGEPATTLSDVYALGVILTEALGTQNLPRMADMTAILNKATAGETAARYQSVEAFLSDIDRYRNQRAVSAISLAPTYRVKRFLGRHKLSVGAAALAVMALIGTTIFTSLLYLRSERAEAIATQRFEDVRSLAKFMMFDLYDTLDPVPGTTGAREKMAEQAGLYLDKLGADGEASFELRLETALGYKRLGDVLGNPMIGNLGEREKAGELLEKAYAETKALSAEDPSSDDALRGFAETAFAYSVYAFIALDDNQQAYDLATESKNAYQALMDRGEPVMFDRLGALGAQTQMADALSYLGRGEESIEEQRRVIAEIDGLVEAQPTDLKLQRNAATSRANIAGAYYQLYEDEAKLREGLAFADEAISQQRAMIAAEVDDAEDIRLYNLTTAFFEAGRIEDYIGESAAAAERYKSAIEILDEALEREPGDLEMLRRWNTFQEHLALAQANMGEIDRAISSLRDVEKVHARLRANEPNNDGYLSGTAQTQYFIADVYANAGRWREACSSVKLARSTYEQMRDAGTLSPYVEETAVADISKIESECGNRSL